MKVFIKLSKIVCEKESDKCKKSKSDDGFFFYLGGKLKPKV